jgi:hypothetical protein
MFKKNINRYNVSDDKLFKIKNGYSHLKNQKKLTKEFEEFIQDISLEELIAIKLHLSTKFLNNKITLYIFENFYSAVASIFLYYAIFNYRSKTQIASFLNLSISDLQKLMKDNNVLKYYDFIKHGKEFAQEDEKKDLEKSFQDVIDLSKE